jgi:hypothetical protein
MLAADPPLVASDQHALNPSLATDYLIFDPAPLHARPAHDHADSNAWVDPKKYAYTLFFEADPSSDQSPIPPTLPPLEADAFQNLIHHSYKPSFYLSMHIYLEYRVV